MTSFIARTFSVISHQPETVAAVLAAARPLMNSSIVPVTLSDDDVWDRLCTIRHHPPKHVLENLLKLFSAFSDTMQFTEKLKFDFKNRNESPRRPDPTILEAVIRDLVENKKYFARTVQSITDFPSIGSIKLCAGKLSNLRSMGVPPSSGLKDSDLELICSKFNRLTQLDLNHQSHLTQNGFKEISRLRFIEHLNLSNTSHVEDLSFLKDLTRFQSLDLGWCYRLTVAKAFSEEGLSLPRLLSVSLAGTEITTFTALQHLHNAAPNLTSLTCSRLDPPKAEEGEPGAVEAIAKMKYLRNLSMVDDIALDSEDTKPFFEMISTKLKFLESLEIYAVDNLDRCLKVLPADGPSLRRLRINECYEFSDVGFCTLASLEDLEVLEIEDQNIRGFTCDLSENNNTDSPFKSLKRLRLSDCSRVGDDQIQSTLRSLSLTSFELSLTGRSITDEGLEAAFEGSNTQYTLEKLNLDVLFGLKTLNCLTNLKVLKELSLWRCPILTNRSLVEAIPKLQHLEVLEVSGNKLTASGIRRATENLRWLKSLVVDEETEAELKHHSRLFFLVSGREGTQREQNVEDYYEEEYPNFDLSCSWKDEEEEEDDDDNSNAAYDVERDEDEDDDEEEDDGEEDDDDDDDEKDEDEEEEEEEDDESLYRECCRHVNVD